MSFPEPEPPARQRILSWLAVATLAAGIVVPVAMLNGEAGQATATTTTRTLGSPPPARVGAAGATVQQPRRESRAKPARSRERAARTRVTGFTWPVGGPWAVTSPYGARGEDGEDMHHGMDIGCALGQPVRASFPGRVIYAADGGAYGLTVLLDHGGSWQTLYGHFDELDVMVGDWADQSEVIGRCGSTGRSTGPHVHFEIRHGGYVWDPARYLPA